MSHSILSTQFSKCPKENYILRQIGLFSWPINTPLKLKLKNLKSETQSPPHLISLPREAHSGHEVEVSVLTSSLRKDHHKGSLWHCKGQGFQGQTPQQEVRASPRLFQHSLGRLHCRSESFLLGAG